MDGKTSPTIKLIQWEETEVSSSGTDPKLSLYRTDIILH